MKKRLHWLTESTRTSVERRNFIAGLWHGAFVAFGVSLTQPTTVISAFVADLTGSTVWVGGLSTVLAVAGTLPQIFVARWIEPRRYKMPYLMAAIYMRVLSWGAIAWLVVTIGDEHPLVLAWVLVGMLAVFYAGGGLGSIPYTDIIGKIIPSDRRGAFFGGIGAIAGPLSLGAALLARRILAEVHYPMNYALLFGLASAGLAIASIGFWVMREPPAADEGRQVLPWKMYWGQILAAGSCLKELVVVQLLTGFSLMAMPFYVVYARDDLHAPVDAVGWFLLAQVAGGVLSNLVWARLVDRAGSRRMLFFYALTALATPLSAIALGRFGWQAMVIVFILAGASLNGQGVGFISALLELAPTAKRATYAGVNAVLILPVAFLPLAAGSLLQHWSYEELFLFTAVFITAGAGVIYRWASRKQGVSCR